MTHASLFRIIDQVSARPIFRLLWSILRRPKLVAVLALCLGSLWFYWHWWRPELSPSDLARGSFARLLHRPRGKVGLVVGHWPSDPGAVCPDGLREMDLNLSIARQVAGILGRYGYRVELLAEFDPALKGYRADVLLSLHSDSCAIPASGFKVARAATSAIPDREDRLVECLYEEYERATSLSRHEATITPDMLYYHAFYEVAPSTPAAIIEMGFLSGDRKLLTRQPERAARGIASGLLCFLKGP